MSFKKLPPTIPTPVVIFSLSLGSSQDIDCLDSLALLGLPSLLILAPLFSTFASSADEFHIAPNKNLVNFADLNRILHSENFLQRGGQLRAVHVILGFKPISKRFQSPKHAIKAKDSRLALIDIAVLGFLTESPPFSTQGTRLFAPLTAKLLYSHKQPLPFDEE
ncbi:hypothetical protein SO802_011180 [Lithocarpus litseifolius]|uniref:Uncharacterized protein n=1 Tax=Lithocarpus litseifolius TaxID=425828 RepID=A0AAW2D0L1_9ROSI